METARGTFGMRLSRFVGMALEANGQPITAPVNGLFDLDSTVPNESRGGRMNVESPARPREFAAPVGSGALAEGLLLVRASTLKLIRLQLAMERQDRRVALEAVDDLVELDRRLQHYLSDVPAAGEQLLFRNALNEERAMLNREKLTLAAQVIRKPVAEERNDDDWLGPRNLPVPIDEPRGRRWWIVAGLPVLVTGLAASAYLLTPSDALARLTEIVGAIG